MLHETSPLAIVPEPAGGLLLAIAAAALACRATRPGRAIIGRIACFF
jgi:hypothetical protein